MNEAAKRVLKTWKVYIADNLCNTDFPRLLDYLENKTILTENHIQRIQAEKTDNGKIARLLYILPRRGPDAFQAFVESLRPDYDFLSDKLQTEYEAENERNKQEGIQGSSSQESLPSLDESHHLCYRCLQDTCMDSNGTVICTANQISAPNQPMKEDKCVSTEETDKWTGTNGSCDRLQPMETQHSEFMKKMMNEKLTCLYTKLKSYLITKNIRELSCQSPKPVTSVMVDTLIDQLIGEVENCFRALDAKDRHSLLTHVISLKDSKKKLKEDLKEAQDLKNKYATALIKEQNKSTFLKVLIQQKNLTIRRLQDEKASLEEKLSDTEQQLTKLKEEVREMKEESEATTRKLNDAEEYIKRLNETSKDLQKDNDYLRHELKELKFVKENENYKRFGQSKGYSKVESPRNNMNGQFAISNSMVQKPKWSYNNTGIRQTQQSTTPVNDQTVMGMGLNINRGQQKPIQNTRKTTLISEPRLNGRVNIPHVKPRNGRPRVAGNEQHSTPLAGLSISGSTKK